MCMSIASLLLGILIGCVAGKKPPPNIVNYCHQDDPQINECMKKGYEEIKPFLKVGVPGLGIPPMDPLILPEAELTSGNNFRARFLNIHTYHLANYEVKSIKFDPKKLSWKTDLIIPELRITTNYEVMGRILILQLNGTGISDGNFTNILLSVAADGEKFTKKEKEYVQWSFSKVDLKLGNSTLLFENLFPGNQELTDNTNKVINENIDSLIDELRPVLNTVVGKFLIGIVNRLFAKFPFDELFSK